MKTAASSPNPHFRSSVRAAGAKPFPARARLGGTRREALACAAVLLALRVPARSAETGAFVDVTRESGVAFQHTFGDEKMTSILEATGSGCAFLDSDGDGVLDLYFVSGGYLEGLSDPKSREKGRRAVNRLFRGRGDGTFEDVTEKAGVGDPGYGMGVVAADYDGDGDTDIYVTNYGRNTLYRNRGDGTFEDATDQAGVGCELWSVGAVFFDYDADGDLDLFVGNYLEFDPEVRGVRDRRGEFPGPLSYKGQRDFLYRNHGDGTFEEVAEAAGVGRDGRAMGVFSADFDGDGDADLYVANDAMENYLYENLGGGRFSEIGLASGTAFSADGSSSASMGGEFADFDRDGLLDLFVPDIRHNNLYRNLGDRLFEDVTVQSGVARACLPHSAWGGSFLDFDNDGDLDLFVANGSEFGVGTEENLLLEHVRGPDGRRSFRKADGGPALRVADLARGCAVGDYDSDGDLDVAILCLDRPSRLLRNDVGNKNHWIKVRLRGTKSNRDGIGARVTVRAGDLVLVEERKSAASYISQNDPRLHFGLGSRTKVDAIEVRWPSGRSQRLLDVRADEILDIVEPEAAE
ncbi:MAG: CRTAC1 family protein [Planctomycetota bacterium]